MGLTWRDAVSGVIVVAAMLVYAAYLGGVRLFLVSSAWAASATVLALGFGCAVFATGDLYTRPQSRSGVILRRVTCGIGAVAAGYGLAGIVANSGYALRNLVMLVMILWGTAALWHVLTIRPDQ